MKTNDYIYRKPVGRFDNGADLVHLYLSEDYTILYYYIYIFSKLEIAHDFLSVHIRNTFLSSPHFCYLTPEPHCSDQRLAAMQYFVLNTPYYLDYIRGFISL